MRLVERLQEYLDHRSITPYAFEHACRLSNGYLGKQLKGKGSVGSEILERIKTEYADLCLLWLVTGKGKMLLPATQDEKHAASMELNEEQAVYFSSKDDVIKLLNKQIAKLEATIADKSKIIAILETQIKTLG